MRCEHTHANYGLLIDQHDIFIDTMRSLALTFTSRCRPCIRHSRWQRSKQVTTHHRNDIRQHTIRIYILVLPDILYELQQLLSFHLLGTCIFRTIIGGPIEEDAAQMELVCEECGLLCGGRLGEGLDRFEQIGFGEGTLYR